MRTKGGAQRAGSGCVVLRRPLSTDDPFRHCLGGILQLVARGSNDFVIGFAVGDCCPANMRESAAFWFVDCDDGRPAGAEALMDIDVRHRQGVTFPFDVRTDGLPAADLDALVAYRGLVRTRLLNA